MYNLPLTGVFYVTHAFRALQVQDLLAEGINGGSHTYFFDHTRTRRAFPDEGSAQCRGHLRDNPKTKDDTHHSLTYSFYQGGYDKDNYDGQIIFGETWGPKAS